jgi:hypothetical protein
MKNKLLLMVLILIIFQGALSSQTLALRGDFYWRGASYFSKNISLDLKDYPLGDAISQISNLTGIKF